jgi:hypothetical protein
MIDELVSPMILRVMAVVNFNKCFQNIYRKKLDLNINLFLWERRVNLGVKDVKV